MSKNSIHIGSHRIYSLGYQRIPIIPRKEIINKCPRVQSERKLLWRSSKGTTGNSLKMRRLSLGDHRGIHLARDRPRYLIVGAEATPLGIDGVKFFDSDFVEKVSIDDSGFPGYPFKVSVISRKPDNTLFQNSIYDYKARAGMKVFFMDVEASGGETRLIHFCFLFKDDFRNRESIKGFIKDLEWYPHIEKEIKIEAYKEST